MQNRFYRLSRLDNPHCLPSSLGLYHTGKFLTPRSRQSVPSWLGVRCPTYEEQPAAVQCVHREWLLIRILRHAVYADQRDSGEAEYGRRAGP